MRGIFALLLLNTAIVGAAWLLRQEVVPGWKKGPLIDPAAPYAPENAVVLFAVVACFVVDLYLLALGAWRRQGARRQGARRRWVPLAALAAAVALAESGMRLYLDRAQVTAFRPHPTLHWQPRPDLQDLPVIGAPGTTISTNADGMRAVHVPREKPANTLRILVLGDSSNFGHGVNDPETWAAGLEGLLEGKIAGSRVEVLNGACPGWTTHQGVEFLRTVGLAYGPDLVVAGFNNDPGPDYFGDRARVMPPVVRALTGVLFRFETYLLAREVTLSVARRLFPAKDLAYTARTAGSAPTYGKLAPAEHEALVPRVPLDEFLENVETIDRIVREAGARFVWMNLPINRTEQELVERYVDPTYRVEVATLAARAPFPLVDVDTRWLRTREPDLHCDGHVFHPCKKGHARIAQQIAAEILPILGGVGESEIGGPPPSRTEATLRLGYSTFTPVHAHVGAVLEAMPGLAAKHGLDVELAGYATGGQQGEDVARGALDAFFTSGAPAIQMVASRSDQRIVASPGDLGRVLVLAKNGAFPDGLAGLRGKRVGFAPGSTTALYWRAWGQGVGATDVPLKTEELAPALAEGRVDAVVAWDPWAEQMMADPGLAVLAERPFRSVLSLSVPWATYEPGRGTRLVALVEESLRIAAADRPRWDAVVAEKSGWSLNIVRVVADRNALLAGRSASLTREAVYEEWLGQALAFARIPGLTLPTLLAPSLLEGTRPEPRTGPRTRR